MTDTREFQVDAEGDGLRVDKFLAGAVPDLSRSVIGRLIAADEVTVNGRPCAASRHVRLGDSVGIRIPPPAASSLEPETRALSILHEDADLVVLDKPAGLIVHPAAGTPGGTLVNALLAHCGDSLRGVGGEIRPGIVHRLDKGTSGVMVIAKCQAAHQSLSEQFAERSVEKIYYAVVRGVADEEGRVDAPIGRSTTARTRMAVGTVRARAALTEWTRLEIIGRSVSTLAVTLHTGRTHQVRVHLTHAGLPLVGDPTYGPNDGLARDPRARPILAAFERPALHAWRLAFNHPEDGRRMSFEAPIPADLLDLLARLRNATKA